MSSFRIIFYTIYYSIPVRRRTIPYCSGAPINYLSSAISTMEVIKMFCPKCGSENSNNAAQCQSCGCPIPRDLDQIRPEKMVSYKPLGMWQYFGLQILFAIPFLGFILIILFSLGVGSNINLRNFARSYLCAFIVIIVLLAVLCIILAVTGTWEVFWSDFTRELANSGQIKGSVSA